MPTPIFNPYMPSPNESMEQRVRNLTNSYIDMVQQMQYLLTGHLDDKNVQSITTDKLIAGYAKIDVALIDTLTVGTNVQIGTAQDAAGVTTIIGNTVTTGYVNALGITSERVTVKDGATILLDSYKDTNGGKFIINDINGNPNVRIGSEGAGGSNVGGVVILYNDSISDPRAAMGIVSATDSGVILLYGSNDNARIELEADHASYGAFVGVRDSSQVLQSYLSATVGYIAGEQIATRTWSGTQYSLTSHNHGTAYVKAGSQDVRIQYFSDHMEINIDGGTWKVINYDA